MVSQVIGTLEAVDTRMKVLHVIPSVSPSRGGPSQAVIEFVRALREVGVDAEIATTVDDQSSSSVSGRGALSTYRDVPVRFFSCYGQERGGIKVTQDNGFLFSWDMYLWLRRHLTEYDLMHAHYLFSFAPTIAAYLARRRGIPYVVRTIGQLAPWALARSRLKKQLYSMMIERNNLEMAELIHCTSEGEANDVRAFGIMRPITVQPLGVAIPPVIPDAAARVARRYGIDPQKQILLFLSRLHPKKRLELLIESFAELPADSPVQLIIAGSGDPLYQSQMLQMVRERDLNMRVTFVGFVQGDEKAELFQAADLFVLPSYSENFGIAVAEAMAHGVVPIITPGVQIADQIHQNRAGVVVEESASELRVAIVRLLEDSELRAQMGVNAREFARRTFSWGAIAARWYEIYRGVSLGYGQGASRTPAPIV